MLTEVSLETPPPYLGNKISEQQQQQQRKTRASAFDSLHNHVNESCTPQRGVPQLQLDSSSAAKSNNSKQRCAYDTSYLLNAMKKIAAVAAHLHGCRSHAVQCLNGGVPEPPWQQQQLPNAADAAQPYTYELGYGVKIAPTAVALQCRCHATETQQLLLPLRASTMLLIQHCLITFNTRPLDCSH